MLDLSSSDGFDACTGSITAELTLETLPSIKGLFKIADVLLFAADPSVRPITSTALGDGFASINGSAFGWLPVDRAASSLTGLSNVGNEGDVFNTASSAGSFLLPSRGDPLGDAGRGGKGGGSFFPLSVPALGDIEMLGGLLTTGTGALGDSSAGFVTDFGETTTGDGGGGALAANTFAVSCTGAFDSFTLCGRACVGAGLVSPEAFVDGAPLAVALFTWFVTTGFALALVAGSCLVTAGTLGAENSTPISKSPYPSPWCEDLLVAMGLDTIDFFLDNKPPNPNLAPDLTSFLAGSGAEPPPKKSPMSMFILFVILLRLGLFGID